MLKHALGIIGIGTFLGLIRSSSTKEEDSIYILPDSGYNWPSVERSYWPTEGWQTAFLARGSGGQIIGVAPELDLVVQAVN